MVVRPIYDGDDTAYRRKSLEAVGRRDSSQSHFSRVGSFRSSEGSALPGAGTADSVSRSGSFRSRDGSFRRSSKVDGPASDAVVMPPRAATLSFGWGEKVALRGSRETWEAIRDDFVVPGLCLACRSTLFAIQDAAYVYCPDCRTVSPMEGVFVDPVSAGVGLGLRPDDLVRFQCEILREEQHPEYRLGSHGGGGWRDGCDLDWTPQI